MSKEWDVLTFNERVLVGFVMGGIAGAAVGLILIILAFVWLWA